MKGIIGVLVAIGLFFGVVVGGVNAVSVCPCTPGDINVDGVVDEVDLSAITSSYLRVIDDPNYNARADIDGSGQVNVRDFALFQRWYGVDCRF